MAEDLSVRVQNLSKRYRRRGRAGGGGKATQGDFWALRDVSFDVRRSEFVGILGRNGAGKSTLLRILARITYPTSGRVEYRGRVGSLLEIGAGFHAELTGRENIYLSGAVLGMPRAEIRRRFDEIVAFSEVEAALDTPVKHYSSGMYVRLAFAVAAHLEPSILLVDEVLAVGDARFFTKSRERMLLLNQQGMTILLVTHNMWLVQNSCSRAICLDDGMLIADGDPVHAIATYKSANSGGAVEPGAHLAGGEIRRFDVTLDDGASVGTSRSSLKVDVSARLGAIAQARFFARVTTPDGLAYFSVRSELVTVPPNGEINAVLRIDHLMLLPGAYLVWVGVCSDKDENETLAVAHAPVVIGGSDEPQRDGLFWNRGEWRIYSSV